MAGHYDLLSDHQTSARIYLSISSNVKSASSLNRGGNPVVQLTLPLPDSTSDNQSGGPELRLIWFHLVKIIESS